MKNFKKGDILRDTRSGGFDVIVLDVVNNNELILMKQIDYDNRFDEAMNNSEFYSVVIDSSEFIFITEVKMKAFEKIQMKAFEKIEQINRDVDRDLITDEMWVTNLMFASVEEIKQIENIYHSIKIEFRDKPLAVFKGVKMFAPERWGDQNIQLFRNFEKGIVEISDSVDVKKLFMDERELKLFEEIGEDIKGFGFKKYF